MQFITTIVVVLLCIIGSKKCVTAQTDMVPRVVFNGPGSCTAEEYKLIDEIFLLPARRSLIRSEQALSRELTLYPNVCNKICAGFQYGQCRSPTYPMCRGYRRREQATSCEAQLEMYHSKLDTLRHNVSESCHSYLGDRYSRTAECLVKTEYGEVVGARLWNVTSTFTYYNAAIVQERLPATGYSLCKNVPFTIESINDPCVKNATMYLTGPPGFYAVHRTETRIPYTLSGDWNKKFVPSILKIVGNYTLSITPDKNTQRTKTWRFTVKNC